MGTGGREMFGFPKHPIPAEISHEYVKEGEKNVALNFECSHMGKKALTVKCALPETVEGAAVVPMDVPETAPDAQIGGPRLGGTHKGHNGALQSFYKTSVKCTQTIAPWSAETDSLVIGD